MKMNFCWWASAPAYFPNRTSFESPMMTEVSRAPSSMPKSIWSRKFTGGCGVTPKNLGTIRGWSTRFGHVTVFFFFFFFLNEDPFIRSRAFVGASRGEQCEYVYTDYTADHWKGRVKLKLRASAFTLANLLKLETPRLFLPPAKGMECCSYLCDFLTVLETNRFWRLRMKAEKLVSNFL